MFEQPPLLQCPGRVAAKRAIVHVAS